MPQAAVLMTDTALPWSFLAVTEDAFWYLGHTQWQESCSILLVMYSAYNAFLL